jgi:hypothetical protein
MAATLTKAATTEVRREFRVPIAQDDLPSKPMVGSNELLTIACS